MRKSPGGLVILFLKKKKNGYTIRTKMKCPSVWVVLKFKLAVMGSVYTTWSGY